MNSYWLTLSLAVLIAFSGCSDDDNDPVDVKPCGPEVVISNEAYKNAPDDALDIKEVQLSGNCLTISFGASGCSGESWELQLIASADIAESLPPQQSVRISLKNEEVCLAYFERAVEFDITSLNANGEIQLNLLGYGQILLAP